MELSVLVSSAGRRGHLVECLRESGRSLGLTLRIVAADLCPELSSACQIADKAIAMPRSNSLDFVPSLLEVCERERIRLVIPTIDPELLVLSQNRDAFAAIGTKIAVSTPEAVGIAGDKELTASVLESKGVRTPRTISAARYVAEPELLTWPVILKPRAGSSSVGIVRPITRDRALEAASIAPELIVQELWQGREFTVNLYFDGAGQLRCAVPHWRIETRAGEVSKGRIERSSLLQDAARKVASALPGAWGALCFQAIVPDQGDYAIFEINARFGGGYPLAHRAGARFTQWLLEEVCNLPVSANDGWTDGVTMLRYDTAAFIHE